MQAFRGSRRGNGSGRDGLEGEKIGDCVRRRGKFEVGGVDDFLNQGSAAGDFDGLSAVMGLMTASACRGAGLSAA